jgi:hypothetical protein
MNKIYKVIWSKARNCYVAVSELAGSHDTSSVRKQQVIAAVVAALLVGMPFSGNVFADTATGTVDNKGQVVVNVTPKTTAEQANNGWKPNITVNSVVAGNAMMTGNGFAMMGEKGQPVYYITKDGLNANDQKITNVAAGTENSDAVNFGQLKQFVSDGNTDTHIDSSKSYAVDSNTHTVSMDVVNKSGTKTGAVTITDVAKASEVGDVSAIDEDLQNKPTEANPNPSTTVVDAVNNLNGKVGDLDYNATNEDGSKKYTGAIDNGDSTTEAIGKLNNQVSGIGQTAKEHSSVVNTDGNITVDDSKTNTAGGTEYKVGLNKEIINLDNVTIEGTKGNITANTVTAGKTSISDSGVVYDGKTYIDGNGINANNQKITNVAAGDVSKDSTDAVNGSQLYGVQQDVTNVNNNVTNLGNKVNNLDDRVDKVGAGAAALAALHPLDFDPDDKWDFAVGYGNYRSANAAAVGAFYRPNEDTMFSVGGSFGNGENMVNAGLSLKFGQGNHVSTSKVAMAKEIKDMRKELEAMKSAMLDQNAGRKIDTSKLQLFPDVPENHWAYQDVAVLAGNGIIKGYPDGTFDGTRPMTRYEFASMLYRAMLNGATLSDKMLNEFAPELERFTVDAVHKDKNGKATVERVRVVKNS